MMSDLREFIGVISHTDFLMDRDGFEARIKRDAHREFARLGYVVKDQITEWIKKPSFMETDGESEWACRVTCIIDDHLEEAVRHG